MIRLLKNIISRFKQLFTGETTQALARVEAVTSEAERTLSAYTLPARRSILKRFPVIFALLVTTGASATLLGIERLITKIDFLNDSPFLLLLAGVTILAFTGKLYKKLS